MKLLTKIDQMTGAKKQIAIKQFWELPENAIFPPEVVALICNIPKSWLQVKRYHCDGIPFIKVNSGNADAIYHVMSRCISQHDLRESVVQILMEVS